MAAATQQAYFVFAAGNHAADACSNALSQFPGALLVAAAKKNGQLWPYSNYGSCVDIKAPAYFQLNSTAKKPSLPFAGTSAAAAYVSAMLAVTFMSGLNFNPTQFQLLVLPADAEISDSSDH